MTLRDLIEAIETSGAPLDTQIGTIYGANYPDEIEVHVEEFGEGHPTLGGTFASIGEPTA